MKGNPILPAASAYCVVAVFIFLSAATAHAYALPGTSPAEPAPVAVPAFDFGSSFQNLLSPFNNFIQSMRATGDQSVSLPVSQNNFGMNAPENIFRQFDDWVYATVGFRPSEALHIFLNIFSWVLGVLKQLVDWLLSLF